MEYKKCCFTGHRPSSLPWKYNEYGEIFDNFKKVLTNKIEEAILNGYNYFISGMALGTDLLAAKIVLNLKKKYKHIILECAIPCTNQTDRWTDDSKHIYNKILKKSDKVTYVSNLSYFNGCMERRNKYMVENSELVIACFNGKIGGTAQTIRLAKMQGKKVIIINPNNL